MVYPLGITFGVPSRSLRNKFGGKYMQLLGPLAWQLKNVKPKKAECQVVSDEKSWKNEMKKPFSLFRH
jgi:hypothetical protein